MSLSAKAAGIGRRIHYDWLNETEYAALFEDAKAEACDVLEMEMWRRAVKGVTEPVWYLGEMVGTVRKYSDTLAIFLAKGLMPGKYRERREITGPDGGPIETRSTVINVTVDD